MISDKPRRLKPSDCVTPADPMTNSFMGSIRGDKNAANTHTRLHESGKNTTQIQSKEVIIGINPPSGLNEINSADPPTTTSSFESQVIKPKSNPYAPQDHHLMGDKTKKPLVG